MLAILVLFCNWSQCDWSGAAVKVASALVSGLAVNCIFGAIGSLFEPHQSSYIGFTFIYCVVDNGIQRCSAVIWYRVVRM